VAGRHDGEELVGEHAAVLQPRVTRRIGGQREVERTRRAASESAACMRGFHHKRKIVSLPPIRDCSYVRGMEHPSMLPARIAEVPAVEVGHGCARRDLPSLDSFRAWVVEMSPGAEWPRVDVHDTGEAFLVLEGEVIEGDRRFGPGTYVLFDRGTAHRPRTEGGVRLFGFNVVEPLQR
jgi:mannose-6-phosphate isomerase-like protein (cupin superfamily)